MRLIDICIAFFLFSPAFCYSQKLCTGLIIGGTNYSGDLTSATVDLNETQHAAGFFLRYQFTDGFALRSGISYGHLKVTDDNQVLKGDRNLDFRSHILDLNLVAELYYPGFNKYKRTASPYIFAGFSAFYFNPQAEYNGNWVDLQPLGTEGQGTSSFPGKEKYSRISFSVPFGAGMLIGLGRVNIGLEIGIRKTFTDYLDDVSTIYPASDILLVEHGEVAVAMSNRTTDDEGNIVPVAPNSQRGNPLYKDYFSISGITITYDLGKGNKMLDNYRCPKVF